MWIAWKVRETHRILVGNPEGNDSLEDPKVDGAKIFKLTLKECMYRGADKSLARPTSRYILFDGENISFDAILLYIYI